MSRIISLTHVLPLARNLLHLVIIFLSCILIFYFMDRSTIERSFIKMGGLLSVFCRTYLGNSPSASLDDDTVTSTSWGR